MSVIRLEEITKSYKMGDTVQQVLHGVSLEVEQGELLSIMGSSGSGKSTIMNIVGLLDKANTGKYYLNDRDVSTLTDNEMATIRNQTIGFVFQQFYLLPKLTAEQNVAMPLTYRQTPKAEIKERVHTMLGKVGMAERSHHKPSELSGGQQQRVALARALVGNPSVILADEPTGALDSQTSKDVMTLFKELNEEEGVTLIIITHDPKVGNACQRRIFVKDGLIVKEEHGCK